MPRALLGFFVLASVACSSPTGPLAVTATGAQSLRLVNPTAEPIYYFVVECDAAALINWAPCTDPAHCKTVPARGARSVPYAEIAFYTPQARRAIVYWWHLRAAGGGFHLDSIRASTVDL